MNNSSNIKRCIKKPMVALLVSLLLLISIPFSVYALEDISTLFTASNGTVTGTSDSITVSNTQWDRTAYANLSCGSGTIHVSFTRTSTPTQNTLFGVGNVAGVSVTFSNLVGVTQSGSRNINVASGVSSGSFDVTFSGTNLVMFASGTGGSNIGSTTYTFTELTIDNTTYVGGDNPSGYTNIESGNIVYFDLGASKPYDITLESQFYSNSGILSGTWSDDNRRYGFSNELPVADTNFGETAGSGILWTKSTKGQNILGQTKIGDANITGTTTAKYLWIINPMYNNKYFEDSLDAKALNGLITVTGVPAGTTVYTYKLKQNASSIGLESTIPDVSGGTGTVSDTTGTQTTYVSTDDNETPYTQTVGGDNSAPEEVTATEGIRQTLDQLSNSFSTLFLAPVEYIQNLISSGSAFMQTLGGIFSWLPEPVVSLFLSALVLMIVIGVIKMLL